MIVRSRQPLLGFLYPALCRRVAGGQRSRAARSVTTTPRIIDVRPSQTRPGETFDASRVIDQAQHFVRDPLPAPPAGTTGTTGTPGTHGKAASSVGNGATPDLGAAGVGAGGGPPQGPPPIVQSPPPSGSSNGGGAGGGSGGGTDGSHAHQDGNLHVSVPAVQPPGAAMKRATYHYFDTFSVVTRLESSGFAHGQAVSMMDSIRALLVNGTEVGKVELLSKAELENQTYLFRAAMAELRNEVVSMRKAASQQLALDAAQLQRNLERLDQKMREDTQTMRTEVEMDVEMRKSQARSEGKDIELRIQELDNKFTVRLGDLRTATEKYKWETTRRLLAGLFVVACAVTYLINRPKQKKRKDAELAAAAAAAAAAQSGLAAAGQEGAVAVINADGTTTWLDAAENDETRRRPGNTFVSLG